MTQYRPILTQYCPILTQYHHVSTSTGLYWHGMKIICPNIQMSDFPLSTWDEHSCTLVSFYLFFSFPFWLTITTMFPKIWIRLLFSIMVIRYNLIETFCITFSASGIQESEAVQLFSFGAAIKQKHPILSPAHARKHKHEICQPTVHFSLLWHFQFPFSQ